MQLYHFLITFQEIVKTKFEVYSVAINPQIYTNVKTNTLKFIIDIENEYLRR